METTLIDKVESAIRARLHDCTFVWDESDGRLFGVVTSSGFEGLTDRERQQRIWGFLQQELTREEQLRILAILTVTPDEDDVLEQEPHDRHP